MLAAIVESVRRPRLWLLAQDIDLRGRGGLRRYLLGSGALAVLYYLSAKIGFELRFTGPIAGIVWLPAGVAVSFLALGGLRFWPGALLGDLLANNYTAVALGGALCQTTGNLIEVLLGAYLLRRLMQRGSPFDSTASVARLLGAIGLSTGASALIGPLSLVAFEKLSFGEFPSVARTWWLGDACGMLIVAPLAISWFGPPSQRPEHLPNRRSFAVLAVTGSLVWISMLTEGRVAYLVFPALLYAAVRCGSRTAAAAVAITASAAVWATTSSEGPFIFDSMTRSVFSTQFFIVISAASTLFVGALVTERELAVHRAVEARADALLAQHVERQRLERGLHDGVQQRLLSLLLTLKEAGRPSSRLPLDEVVDDTADGLVVALRELRTIARDTYPAILADAGLAAAIDELAVRSTVPLVVGEAPAGRFDVATESIAYFVIDEVVTNAQTHALASLIDLRVYSTEQGVRIVVSDDGRGGAADPALAELRERVESLGGSFRISSSPDGGTAIHALVPHLYG